MGGEGGKSKVGGNNNDETKTKERKREQAPADATPETSNFATKPPPRPTKIRTRSTASPDRLLKTQPPPAAGGWEGAYRFSLEYCDS